MAVLAIVLLLLVVAALGLFGWAHGFREAAARLRAEIIVGVLLGVLAFIGRAVGSEVLRDHAPMVVLGLLAAWLFWRVFFSSDPHWERALRGRLRGRRDALRRFDEGVAAARRAKRAALPAKRERLVASGHYADLVAFAGRHQGQTVGAFDWPLLRDLMRLEGVDEEELRWLVEEAASGRSPPP